MNMGTTSTVDFDDLVAADLRHLVHPYSKVLRDRPIAPTFVSASGLRMLDIDGQDWLDACSGLLNVNLGYGREELADAAAKALRELSYGNLFFGRGHPRSTELAERLVEITPDGITRFFYTLSGSDSVDTVIKFVRYASAANGRPEKTNIIGRFESYHGMSLGATSMTGDPALWEYFGPLLPGFSHIGQPGADAAAAAQALEDEILRLGANTVAAFLAEPISMPARINIPPKDYWPKIREVCDRHNVLLALDETITGWGRTGRMFAAEHWDLKPDLLITSKGITSGYLPLGAVGITDAVAEMLAGDGRMLPHGFTAGGHPASCAVALATIDFMEREDVVAASRETGAYLHEGLVELCRRQNALRDVHSIGMLAAVEIDTGAVGESFGKRLLEHFMSQRVLIREYDDGSTFAFAPPLTSTKGDIDEVIQRAEAAIEACGREAD